MPRGDLRLPLVAAEAVRDLLQPPFAAAVARGLLRRLLAAAAVHDRLRQLLVVVAIHDQLRLPTAAAVGHDQRRQLLVAVAIHDQLRLPTAAAVRTTAAARIMAVILTMTVTHITAVGITTVIPTITIIITTTTTTTITPTASSESHWVSPVMAGSVGSATARRTMAEHITVDLIMPRRTTHRRCTTRSRYTANRSMSLPRRSIIPRSIRRRASTTTRRRCRLRCGITTVTKRPQSAECNPGQKRSHSLLPGSLF